MYNMLRFNYYYLDISNLEPPIFQPVHEPTDGKTYYKR